MRKTASATHRLPLALMDGAPLCTGIVRNYKQGKEVNVTFNCIPVESYRDYMKKRGYRWDPVAKVWWHAWTIEVEANARYFVGAWNDHERAKQYASKQTASVPAETPSVPSEPAKAEKAIAKQSAKRAKTVKKSAPAKKSADCPVKVGDVFTQTHHYHGEYFTHYEVVEVVGPKTVRVRKVRGIQSYEGKGGFVWLEVPAKGLWADDELLTKRIAVNGDSISMSFEFGKAFRFAEGTVFHGSDNS